jgi:hypothetical protein
MTLAMSLVTSYGTWASTDHRLTSHPDGRVITESSVKHVVITCSDGSALISFTGLGRVGRIDVSAWARGILRGEGRTVDETLIDLREQASRSIGPRAHSLGVQHAFLAGAYLSGRPWALAIANIRHSTPLAPVQLQPTFETSGVEATEPVLLVGGYGQYAVSDADRALITRISRRRPARPRDYMQVLGDVTRRAAESSHPAGRSISRSSTVVFMPPSGTNVLQEWYGPEDERHSAPPAFSHILFGIDLSEAMTPMIDMVNAHQTGGVDTAETELRMTEAMQRGGAPKGSPRSLDPD